MRHVDSPTEHSQIYVLSRRHLLEFLQNYVSNDHQLSLHVTKSGYPLPHVDITGLDGETHLKMELSLKPGAALLKHLQNL